VSADACGMVQLLVAAAKQMRQYPQLTGKLGQRPHKMLREAEEKTPRHCSGLRFH